MARGTALADVVTVVVRTAGERTADNCVALAEAQAPGLEVVQIAEVPFSRAVEVAYRIGVDRGRRWTLCLDADVLLRTGALSALVGEAERADHDVSCFEAQVADNLLAGHRHAGCHLYRTAVLARALGGAVEFRSDVIRPESHVRAQLHEQGFPWRRGAVVAGLHGWEQWLSDVFRTALVISHKFPRRRAAWAEEHWRQRGADGDADMLVAAMTAGIADVLPAAPRIDRRDYPHDISALLSLVGLEERSPLPPDGLILTDVDARLAAFTPARSAVAMERFEQTWGRGPLGPLRAMHGRHGTVGLAGEALRRLGQRLATT